MKYATHPFEQTSPLHSIGATRVSLPTLLTELVEAATLQANERGIEISVDVSEDAGSLEGDPAEITRTFRNLLAAALHLTVRDAGLAVSARTIDGMQLIQLDSVARGQASQVRLHRVSSRMPSEASFALHTARQLMAKLDGSIEACFMEDLGVSFTLRVPTQA